MLPMSRPRRIEGYAVVSGDGMLANPAGIMLGSLMFEPDQRFFERGLDGVDVVVHGRHSHERRQRSHLRRRLNLTRLVVAITADPSDSKASLWNPAGASFEHALAMLGAPDGSDGVIGGTDVFGMFLDRFDFFHLSRMPHVRLLGKRPLFAEVPARPRRRCFPTIACAPARFRSSIRQLGWQWSVGNDRRGPTDRTAKVGRRDTPHAGRL
jgi:hypothetical protein